MYGPVSTVVSGLSIEDAMNFDRFREPSMPLLIAVILWLFLIISRKWGKKKTRKLERTGGPLVDFIVLMTTGSIATVLMATPRVSEFATEIRAGIVDWSFGGATVGTPITVGGSVIVGVCIIAAAVFYFRSDNDNKVWLWWFGGLVAVGTLLFPIIYTIASLWVNYVINAFWYLFWGVVGIVVGF